MYTMLVVMLVWTNLGINKRKKMVNKRVVMQFKEGEGLTVFQ